MSVEHQLRVFVLNDTRGDDVFQTSVGSCLNLLDIVSTISDALFERDAFADPRGTRQQDQLIHF